jgi:hypothetical protein
MKGPTQQERNNGKVLIQANQPNQKETPQKTSQQTYRLEVLVPRPMRRRLLAARYLARRLCPRRILS